MSEQLTDIISQALTELEDPAEDTLEAVEELVEETEDVESEDSAELDEEEVSEEASDDEEVEDSDDPDLEKTYEVKVDGEPVEVTLKEALAGYMRQADYTRKAQALAEEVREFEQSTEQFSSVLDQVQALDQAWEEDPIQVLTHFASNTENPTHAVALLIKELAGAGVLEQQFLEMFGITPDVRQSWAQESELSRLRREQSSRQKQDMTRAEAQEQEQAVVRAIAEYDQQIDEILESEGLELSEQERKEFRSDLARYARDNDITNLKAAFKAKKYEESKAKQVLAKKTAERAKAKKAAGVSARGGSAASGGAPVASDNADLRSVIMAAMKETGV